MAIAALAASAADAAIVVNFDGATFAATVDGFYNGGTDSAGASGPNLGVNFLNWVVDSGFGESSPPNFAYFSSSAAGTPGSGTIDVAAGFGHLLSFTYGSFVDGAVSVYSGVDGAGTLLGSLALPAADPAAPFVPESLAFAGTARSVVFTGLSATVGIDDVTLGTAVPEPATWAMLLIGFGGLGAAMRSRRRRSAATA